MDKRYIEITLHTRASLDTELLIEQLNDALEFEGVEEGEDNIKVFFSEATYDDILVKNIIEVRDIKYSISIIENKNWNEIWETNFKPVKIGNKVAIRADFHQNINDVEYEIVITPKMSFGTGHHATTSLMVESMYEHKYCVEKKVLDFGTGTGVLAILAEKMNAREVLAIDHDEWSILNAVENIEKNNCKKITVLQQDYIPDGERWDVILANINLHIIIDHMQRFYQNLKVGGILVISGIMYEDQGQVEAAARSQPFLAVSATYKNNWLCMAFRK
ncbi:MAG TPA: 50S ribosomal protein L11 methyltransferase [Agriterribacter sp.]|nr:50S ribosomal protein L11 methyltransferase [Agriterribacter sp.]